MKFKLILYFLVCSGIIGGVGAHAQTQEPDNKTIFTSYVNSPGYKTYLETIFNKAQAASVKAKCPKMRVIRSNGVRVLKEPTFVRERGNFSVDGGAWVAIAKLDQCGREVRRRALLRAVPGQNLIHPTILLPGEFRGNLKLESDVMRVVLPSFETFGKDEVRKIRKCDDAAKVAILDIQTLKEPSAQGWSETWIGELCDAVVEATVQYKKTDTGVGFTAYGWKAR